MSTKNIFTNLANKDKKIPLFLVLLIIFVIASIVGIASFNIGKKHKNINNLTIPVVDASQISETTKILGQQVYNWTGKITDIEKYYLIINTYIKNSDGSFIEKNITAYVDENTKIIKWDLSNTKNDPTLDNKKPIDYSDLHVGDQIIAKSTNEPDENYDINATDITLLITP